MFSKQKFQCNVFTSLIFYNTEMLSFEDFCFNFMVAQAFSGNFPQLNIQHYFTLDPITGEPIVNNIPNTGVQSSPGNVCSESFRLNDNGLYIVEDTICYKSKNYIDDLGSKFEFIDKDIVESFQLDTNLLTSFITTIYKYNKFNVKDDFSSVQFSFDYIFFIFLILIPIVIYISIHPVDFIHFLLPNFDLIYLNNSRNIVYAFSFSIFVMMFTGVIDSYFQFRNKFFVNPFSLLISKRCADGLIVMILPTSQPVCAQYKNSYTICSQLTVMPLIWYVNTIP